MSKENKNDYQLNVFCIIFIIFILIFSSSPVYCATNYYYYLQVGSFRSVPRALHFAQKLNSLNENTLIRGEDIPDLGYWYRVYLGPFPSYREADHKRQELLKKRFYAKSAFVHKKTFPIQSNLSEEAEIIAIQDQKLIIYFGYNSNEIPEDDYKTLDQLAASLIQNPDVSIIIKGYADIIGRYLQNKKLSESRANIVKSYLVGKGVNLQKIKSLGMGPVSKLENKEFAKGIKSNRRVEIELKK
jgi:outer membrane protein OmpA-like peptidoglycan-associated protein